MNRTHWMTPALFTALLAAGTACSTSAVNQKAFDPRASAPTSGRPGTRPTALSRELAWLRAHQITQVSYVLWFGVDDEHDDYEGRTVVNFELHDLSKSHGNEGSSTDHPSHDSKSHGNESKQYPSEHPEMTRQLYRQLKDVAQIIAIDFEGGDIRSITINGAVADLKEIPGNRGVRYDSHRIYFHTSELNPSGTNRIKIAFSHPFAKDDYGFHRFKDPVDNRVYVYTNSEPYGAHRIFPCFDQPDLKASFELTVETPEDWTVISNTTERDTTRVDGRESWAFPPSPLISPYIFALHAGPFQSWTQDANGIPMRLFVRQSLKAYVDPKEWFDTTRAGLEYYSSYFSYPYPYSKYDQVIVPDFSSGAMENAAAVTFSERYVHRSRPTQEQRAALANTILHEMAHQWFGDLVTMKWWNGLWLNESFATFMAAKAQMEATHYAGSWLDFNGEKSWAYHDDQLVTTHPVEVPVADTDQADTIFDGISYGKGASALKQLSFYLGEDDFREGLQRFFMKYALRNTTTRDLIKMLGEASGKDLSKWQKSWLQTAGLNGLTAVWACENDEKGRQKISQFRLLQSPPEGGTELRTHKTQIAFYEATASGKIKLKSVEGELARLRLVEGELARLRLKDTLTVTYSGPSTEVEDAIGKTCPAFVYPNHEDQDYAKVELDPVSLRAAIAGIGSIESTLQRRMIWNTLWEMVVDGKMRPQDLADAILTQAEKEKNGALRDHLISQAQALIRFLPPETERKVYQARMEAWAMENLRRPEPADYDLKRSWLKAFREIGRSPKAVELARALLAGKAKIAGLPIQQSERWDLIWVLSSAGDADAPALIDSEAVRDGSDIGQKSAIAARAAFANEASKQEWWTKILAPINDPAHAMPITQLGVAMDNFISPLQENLDQTYVDAFFAELPKTAPLVDTPYPHDFAALYPTLCDPRITTLATAVLNANPDLSPIVVKSLKIQRQETERCIRAQERASHE